VFGREREKERESKVLPPCQDEREMADDISGGFLWSAGLYVVKIKRSLHKIRRTNSMVYTIVSTRLKRALGSLYVCEIERERKKEREREREKERKRERERAV
jgi:hypothetical protein